MRNLYEDTVLSDIAAVLGRPIVRWILIENASCVEQYHDLRIFRPPTQQSGPTRGEEAHAQEPIPILRVHTTRGQIYAALVTPTVPLTKTHVRSLQNRTKNKNQKNAGKARTPRIRASHNIPCTRCNERLIKASARIGEVCSICRDPFSKARGRRAYVCPAPGHRIIFCAQCNSDYILQPGCFDPETQLYDTLPAELRPMNTATKGHQTTGPTR